MPYYKVDEEVKVTLYARDITGKLVLRNGKPRSIEIFGKIVKRYSDRREGKKDINIYYDVEQTEAKPTAFIPGISGINKKGHKHIKVPEFNITPIKPYTSSTRSARAEIKLENRIPRNYPSLNQHNSLPDRLRRSLASSGRTRNSTRSARSRGPAPSTGPARSTRSARSANRK